MTFNVELVANGWLKAQGLNQELMGSRVSRLSISEAQCGPLHAQKHVFELQNIKISKITLSEIKSLF